MFGISVLWRKQDGQKFKVMHGYCKSESSVIKSTAYAKGNKRVYTGATVECPWPDNTGLGFTPNSMFYPGSGIMKFYSFTEQRKL